MSDLNPVLIDVDGVVAEFTPYVLSCLQKISKPWFKGTALFDVPAPKDCTSWDFFKDILSPEARKAGYKMLEDPKFWSSIPVMPGAISGVAQIRLSGRQVVWVTSPWGSCKEWAHARTEWLKRNFGAKSGEVVIASKKYLVRGECLIDDKPDNVQEWSSMNPYGIGILFSAPYNRGSFSWSDVDKLLVSLDRARDNKYM